MFHPVTDNAHPISPLSAPVYDAARAYARDRYLAALLAPGDVREDLVALAAYFGELGRIPLIAADVTVGEIRFQWWRDALAAPDGVAAGHPVADALRELARRRSLDPALVALPIEGYARELYEDGLQDEAELALYAEETEGAFLRLALTILGESGRGEALRPVSSAARTLALTRLALTLPQHLALGRMPLPAAFASWARDPRGADEGAAREAVQGLTAVLAGEALAFLARFREEAAGVDLRHVVAYLPLSLVAPYLRAAVHPRRDALLELADISPLSRITRLWFAYLRGRV